MMRFSPAAFAGLANAINVQGLFIAIPLVAFVLLVFYVINKTGRKRKKKPGQLLHYEAPGKTAAECRGLLGKTGEGDMFAYTLEGAASGGWYVHFTGHRPTGQPLDTLYLLQFEGDSPAAFSLHFVREAFGMKEPVIGEGLLDDFFAAKLAARRLPESEANEKE